MLAFTFDVRKARLDLTDSLKSSDSRYADGHPTRSAGTIEDCLIVRRKKCSSQYFNFINELKGKASLAARDICATIG
jgi:hypothetical protein